MRAEKSIVLLGGSNAVLKEGLANGLAQLGNKVHNLALGGTNSIQALYELLRPRNVEILQNADLIVFEKSLNDIGAFANELECASLKVLKRNARWCFETLHKLKRKVCVLLLPRYDCKQLYTEPINDFYRALCVEFGFHFVDVARFYEEHNLEDYAKSADSVHPPLVIMRILGRKIAKYIEDFSLSCTMPKYTGAKFKILTAKEMQGCAKESHLKFMQNSRYSEETYMLYAGDSLTFPPQCNGAKIIGIHTWSRGLKDFNFRFFGAPMLIENKKASMVYETSAINCVFSVKDSFYVSTPTIIRLGEEIPINMLNNALIPPPLIVKSLFKSTGHHLSITQLISA